MTPVAGLVLAAGAGRRLGRPKALVTVAGHCLLDRAVTILRDGGCDPVLAVLGAQATLVRRTATTDFVGVINQRWPTGMASSLRAGLAALPRSSAAVVSLVDQPRITGAAVARLIEAHQAGAEIAVATYDGRRGHPVLFAEALWSTVAAQLTGDAGARAFLAEHDELVVKVDCDGLGDPRDIDTLAQLRAFEGRPLGTSIGAGPAPMGPGRGRLSRCPANAPGLRHDGAHEAASGAAGQTDAGQVDRRYPDRGISLRTQMGRLSRHRFP